jgi:hypothetical protein
MRTPLVNLKDRGRSSTQRRSTGRRKRTPCVNRGEKPTNGLHQTPRGLHTWKPRGYRAGTLTRSPHAQANDYRHRYTGTGVDNRTTGTGRHQKDEDEDDEGEILTTTRRGVGTTTTNERGGDGSGTTEANGEGTTSAAILGQRRDAAGAGLDDAEARTKTMTGLQRHT